MSYVDGFVLAVPAKKIDVYKKMAKKAAKKGELVIFAFIVYKSRAHRDKVNKKVMSDPRLKCDPADMPFDCKNMAYGGFKTIVEF